MERHNIVQGSDAWHEYRRNHFNASDAGAMLGVSPYKTRTALLKEYATGISEEIDSATQARFDEGHRIEVLARALIERDADIDLFPVVGSIGKLSASFDGRTMDGKFLYEHKTLNKVYRAAKTQSDLPVYLRAQLEQQMMISDADVLLFHASKWNGDELAEEIRIEYFPDMKLRQEIIDGWAQFTIDLENYAPAKVIEEKPEAKAVIELPALFLQAEGRLVNSNMEAFGAALAVHLAETRKMVYVTDQDFADADKRAKMYRDTCDKLTLTKQSMLSQTVSIDEAFRMIDTWHEDLRTTALQIEKDVKANTDAKKINIVNEGKIGFTGFIAELEKGIAPIRLIYQMPNFGDAIKGKRLFSAMTDAVETMLANAKVEYSNVALGINANMNWLKQHDQYRFLLSDLQTIVYKASEDFQLLVNSRIAEHKRVEAEKLEAARQQAITEERARAEAAAAIEAAKEKEAEEQRNRIAAAKLADEQRTETAEASAQPAQEISIAKIAVTSDERIMQPLSISIQSPAPTLRLGQIVERLGFTVTSEFLASLGIAPAAKERSAMLYHERDFLRVCEAIAGHIETIYYQHKQAA